MEPIPRQQLDAAYTGKFGSLFGNPSSAEVEAKTRNFSAAYGVSSEGGGGSSAAPSIFSNTVESLVLTLIYKTVGDNEISSTVVRFKPVVRILLQTYANKGRTGSRTHYITLDMLNALLVEHERVMNNVKLVNGTLQYVFKNDTTDRLKQSFMAETLFPLKTSADAPSPFILRDSGAIDWSTLKVIGVIGDNVNPGPPDDIPDFTKQQNMVAGFEMHRVEVNGHGGGSRLYTDIASLFADHQDHSVDFSRCSRISLYIGPVAPMAPMAVHNSIASAQNSKPRLVAFMVATADRANVNPWNDIAMEKPTRLFPRYFRTAFKYISSTGALVTRQKLTEALLLPIGTLYRGTAETPDLKSGPPASAIVRHAMRPPCRQGDPSSIRTAGGSIGTLAVTCIQASRA